jgi:hypothetical protein
MGDLRVRASFEGQVGSLKVPEQLGLLDNNPASLATTTLCPFTIEDEDEFDLGRYDLHNHSRNCT